MSAREDARVTFGLAFAVAGVDVALVDGVLDEYEAAHRAEVLREGFTSAELAMLRFALNEAQEAVWSRDGFTDEDQAALDSLRRLTDATAPTSKEHQR